MIAPNMALAREPEACQTLQRESSRAERGVLVGHPAAPLEVFPHLLFDFVRLPLGIIRVGKAQPVCGHGGAWRFGVGLRNGDVAISPQPPETALYDEAEHDLWIARSVCVEIGRAHV